jgi:Rps23 Pro-64 3,4-dihydroxylase Tpa1-like proline 4-hydroxylase
MSKYIKLEDNIIYFESFIPDCDKLLEIIEETKTNAVTDWDLWRAYGNTSSDPYGEIKKIKRGKLIEVIDNTEKDKSLFIIDTLVNSMILAIKEYGNIFNIDEDKVKYAANILLENETEIGIYKYFEGQSMGSHVDYNEDNNYLEYTIVIYLNDDYEGGELYFNEFDIKVKPKAGSIMMYPSGFPYLHESLKVKKGRKSLITHHWRNSI